MNIQQSSILKMYSNCHDAKRYKIVTKVTKLKIFIMMINGLKKYIRKYKVNTISAHITGHFLTEKPQMM